MVQATRANSSKDVDIMIGTVADEIRYWAHLQYDPADENGNYRSILEKRDTKVGFTWSLPDI